MTFEEHGWRKGSWEEYIRLFVVFGSTLGTSRVMSMTFTRATGEDGSHTDHSRNHARILHRSTASQGLIYTNGEEVAQSNKNKDTFRYGRKDAMPKSIA